MSVVDVTVNNTKLSGFRVPCFLVSTVCLNLINNQSINQSINQSTETYQIQCT